MSEPETEDLARILREEKIARELRERAEQERAERERGRCPSCRRLQCGCYPEEV